ncbi:MAG: response regulator [Desulfobacterales bacterium]|nr:response regulator [Desulfobacterales bacterium]
MDDEQMVRAIAKEMLMELGHEVELSENGKEAIKLYMEAINTNNKFDIVIMDLTIPGGMDGKEAVQEILNLNPDAKVIVSSGYSNDPVMANFKGYGFCSAIAKPYQLQELSKVINQLID